MFRKLSPAKSPAASAAKSSVPPDTIVWAIGDIHGRADLLKPLLAAILDDLTQHPAPQIRKVVVFLGDYIDRGPQSRDVLDILSRLDRKTVEYHFLRGNHEYGMEAVLKDARSAPAWCDYGGRETLRSYGVAPPALRSDTEAWEAAVEKFKAAIPASHHAFLASQEMSVSIGDYFFAHAGARPGVPLGEQSDRDLMWIRREFLDDPAPFEQVVVHGHTPSETVQIDARRIGLDTGGYATGVISALRLERSDRLLMQTSVANGAVALSVQPLP